MDRTAGDPQKLADLNMNRGKMDRASKHVHGRAGKKGNPILPSHISHLCGAEIACFLFPPFLPPRPHAHSNSLAHLSLRCPSWYQLLS